RTPTEGNGSGRTFRPPTSWPRRCRKHPAAWPNPTQEGLTMCDSNAPPKGYNGWTNYETWNVALWIDNEQGSYNHRRELAREACVNAEAGRSFTRKESATQILAGLLKEWIEEGNPVAKQASVYADLVNAALSEVNWHELAENWLEDEDLADENTEAD